MRLIVFLFLFPFSGLAILQPGLLKKIERCELLFDSSAVYPGSEFELCVLTILKDSTQLNSIRGNKISFADYFFELTGAASIQRKSRRKLTIKIHENAYVNPVIGFEVKLRRKKSIFYKVEIPIDFERIQKLSFKGEDGYDPRANTENGYRKIPLTSNINLEFIDNEQTLSNNSDPNIIGRPGPDLSVYISMFSEKNTEQVVRIEVITPDGEKYTRYLKPNIGQLEVSTIGGKGGISKYGGKGGKGGNVKVYITKEAKPYYDQIFILNYGGEGGELWRPKVDGHQQGPFGDDGGFDLVTWDEITYP